jgi:hypothetical protein
MRADPKMTQLDDHSFRIWINLLCLACDSSERGVVFDSPGNAYQLDELARILQTDEMRLRKALDIFVRKLMIQETAKGIVLIHFGERNNIKNDTASVNHNTKQRKVSKPKEQEESLFGNDMQGTQGSEDNELPQSNSRFDEFWNIYVPYMRVKGSRATSEQRWNSLMRLSPKVRPTEQHLLDATKRYIAYCHESHTFTRSAEVFLSPTARHWDEWGEGVVTPTVQQKGMVTNPVMSTVSVTRVKSRQEVDKAKAEWRPPVG